MFNIGPVTESVLCFVCPIFRGTNTFSVTLLKGEMKASVVERKKHCPSFSISGLDKLNITGASQIRDISQLLLLTCLPIVVYHDAGATNKFTFNE